MTGRPIDYPDALRTLETREPFAWLRERDVDLLLCAELHANNRLQAYLAQHTGGEDAAFTGAWISLAELDGESDLVVTFNTEAGWRILLIENKIAATFQPDQAERYQSRAARWRNEEGVNSVWTMLVAPSEYLDRPGAETFDVKMSYEDVATVLRNEPDTRSAFLARALEAGVSAYRRGYVPVPDAAVSDIWTTIWRLSQETAPSLRMRQPATKPGQSTWITFTDADGFANEDRQSVMLIFKAERGQVDLQFSGMSAQELKALIEDKIPNGVNIEKSGKSASLRIKVPVITFSEDAILQEDAIRQGLLECERLRRFFVDQELSDRLRNRT